MTTYPRDFLDLVRTVERYKLKHPPGSVAAQGGEAQVVFKAIWHLLRGHKGVQISWGINQLSCGTCFSRFTRTQARAQASTLFQTGDADPETVRQADSFGIWLAENSSVIAEMIQRGEFG